MIHLAVTLAILLAAQTQPTASQAGGGATIDAPAQDLVTREWTWTDANGVTVLTAQGPADQVAQFEPGDPTSRCPDCLLMSSVAYGQPEDASAFATDRAPLLAGEDR